jgi:hypothetical protein
MTKSSSSSSNSSSGSKTATHNVTSALARFLQQL